MKLFLVVLALFAESALAFEQPAFSPLAPASTVASISMLTVQLARTDPATGKFVGIGTTLKIGLFDFLMTPPLTFDLAMPKTSTVPQPIVITALKWTLAGSIDKNIVTDGALPFFQIIEIPEAVPLGAKVGCRYDMPRQGVDLAPLVTEVNALLKSGPVTEDMVYAAMDGKKFKWSPAPGSGWLNCKAGVSGSSLPAHVAVVVLPTAVVLSPDGTSITAPSGTLTTYHGTWSFGAATATGGNALLLNGTHAAGGFGAKLVVANNGMVYTFTADGAWFQWSSTGWSRLAAAPI